MYPIKAFLFALFTISIVSCDESGERINLFDLEDDIQLGTQINAYIESDSSGIDILDSSMYPIVYYHLHRIKNNIISTDQIKHKKDFPWTVRIIRNDSIINAFATPGGYIYVFTGMIKYLDSEDQLAGVMAHEIAHADRRHSTAMLTKIYGLSFLINIILGNDNEMAGQITQNLLSLKFSRSAEEDADKYSVIYLCHDDSPYLASGITGFFEKMIADQKSGLVPEFLSSHPTPPNRIHHIKTVVKELQCSKNIIDPSLYEELKTSLPD